MELVMCTDKNYVMPCGVMLYSICQNNQDVDITFHIVIDESVNPSIVIHYTNSKPLIGGRNHPFNQINRHFITFTNIYSQIY